MDEKKKTTKINDADRVHVVFVAIRIKKQFYSGFLFGYENLDENVSSAVLFFLNYIDHSKK